MYSIIDDIIGTDKESRHGYISSFYQKEFARYRDMPVVLLEIGVYLGGSLRMWREYFTKGTIYGVDNQLYPVDYILGDAYTREIADSLPDLDIVIDDGSHKLDDQLMCINLYVPKIRPGGVLVIEDVKEDHLLSLKEAARGYDYVVVDLRHVRDQEDNILFVIRL